MVLRTRPAAAFVLFLTVAASGRAGVAQTPMMDVVVMRTADGATLRWEISQSRADQLPRWNPRTSAPPLSVVAAIKTGEMWLTEQNPEVKTFDVASVTLTRGCCAFAQAERWLYQMYFDPVVAGRRLFGGTNFMAVVLLDGSIVEPRIDPAPGQSPAPARTTPGAPAAPSTPVRLGGGIPAPQRIKNVDPVYPADAQNDRVQGVVIIEAIVGADGKIQDARVLRSVPLLDAAALDAVRQWEYTPTILNGVPVPVIMTVTVNFALK